MTSAAAASAASSCSRTSFSPCAQNDGSSRSSPAIAGLELEDPSFWAKGLELVREQLDAAEAAAAEVKAGA